MDKLIHDGTKATISNDGAKILQLLDIVHPAAKTLVDIARAQDAEIGDGTTTVTLLAAEMLRQAKQFIEDGVHPQIIIRGFRKACLLAVSRIREISIGVGEGDKAARRSLLEKCASTALNSKLIARYQDFFAPMIVDAVECLDFGQDLSNIGVKKVGGGSVTESFLVAGVAFKRTFSYAGFEQQPKNFSSPKILCLNLELELKSEKENAEVRIDDPSIYQSIVDAEWSIIYEKLSLCVESGASIVLSRLPIGDLATQYFADRNIFCAGRVAPDDLHRVAKATGAKIQTTVYGMTPSVLGTCSDFEEKQVGAERFNIFKGCSQASVATIVLRGGAEQFIDETERSIHDSIMIVKNCVRNMRVVAGGGATEMELSRVLRDYSRTIEGKQQLVIAAFARAFELIPRQLADNAGFDSTDILNRLRQKHATAEGKWWGVDIENDGICDTYASAVWEPASSKINSVSSATEAACLILSVDETVKNPSSQQEGQGGPPGGGGGRQGMGGGKKISQALGGGGMTQMIGGAKGRGVRMMQGRGGR
jgi:T-complex protein 1 subunit eta